MIDIDLRKIFLSEFWVAKKKKIVCLQFGLHSGFRFRLGQAVLSLLFVPIYIINYFPVIYLCLFCLYACIFHFLMSLLVVLLLLLFVSVSIFVFMYFSLIVKTRFR